MIRKWKEIMFDRLDFGLLLNLKRWACFGYPQFILVRKILFMDVPFSYGLSGLIEK